MWKAATAAPTAREANHFLAGIRRNIGVTYLVHDNQVYGLTKGQASPTTAAGFVTKAQPNGVFNTPFNPVAAAVGLKAGFVARGFSGDVDFLADLIVSGMNYPGFALIDILQPLRFLQQGEHLCLV